MIRNEKMIRGLRERDYATNTYGGGCDQTAIIGHAPESRDWHPGDPAYAPEIDPTARIEAYVTVDAGLWAPTSIGAGTWILKHSHVGHDVMIGSRCEISPSCVLGGHVQIGDDVRIGIGALIRPFVKVGAGARIGMGAVVVKDVPPGALVYGNPAREHVQPDKQGDYGEEPDPRRAAGWSREFGRAMTRLNDASSADLSNHIRKLKQGG